MQFVSRKSRRSQRQGVAIYQPLTKKKVKQNIIINSSQREVVAKYEQLKKRSGKKWKGHKDKEKRNIKSSQRQGVEQNEHPLSCSCCEHDLKKKILVKRYYSLAWRICEYDNTVILAKVIPWIITFGDKTLSPCKSFQVNLLITRWSICRQGHFQQRRRWRSKVTDQMFTMR